MFDIYIFRIFLLPFFALLTFPILIFLFIGVGVFIHSGKIKKMGAEELTLRIINKASISYIKKHGVKIMFINLHLSPDNSKTGEKKRLTEIYTLLNFI